MAKEERINKKNVFREIIGQADVSENDLLALGVGNVENPLEILLRDQTKGLFSCSEKDGNVRFKRYHHIVWATDNYKQRYGFVPTQEIDIIHITDSKNARNGRVIRPRALKSLEEQNLRTKQKAEVFTPSWVCNAQNNLIDESWFGWRKEEHEGKSVFNLENDDQTWEPNLEKIQFPKGKTWKNYVTEPRLEIACGEAPYLVSRYDTTTGKALPVDRRIGLLDRKFRVIRENLVPDKNKSDGENMRTWREWAYKALKSTYGFEWQGDNLLLARENILISFIDYFFEYSNLYFPGFELSVSSIEHACYIISWNLWQMDGIKLIIPYSDQPEEMPCPAYDEIQFDLEAPENKPYNINGILAKIAVWKGKGREKYHDEIIFKSLTEKTNITKI